jgi:serine/threonine protein phosphatase PrpC
MSDLGISAAVHLQAAFCTDPGRVRTNNEDVPLLDINRGVYGVIDGIGGHAAGEIAAGIAADVILQRLARPLGTPAERVREAIAIANNEIFRRADELPDLHGMACVVTLALVNDGTLTIGHVGDSRLYLLNGAGMHKLTHDHSPVGEREDAREMSELDAMRHPRRNEVFRDVGSAFRDKDDDEFVEIVEAPFTSDSAILLCTDGLTDLVPAAVIERIVRRHAGRPQLVAEALVDAANEAGGKDNVTVVYAEAPGFPSAGPRRFSSPVDDDGEHWPSPPDLILKSEDERVATAPRPRGRAARLARSLVRSRILWFAAGALTGIAAALALMWRLGVGKVEGGRTLVVGGTAPAAFSRISDAAAAAQPGDVIRIEPGIYHERIDVPDGVDLIARVAGTVTVVRPDEPGDAAAITAIGDSSARIQGIRIESTPERPFEVGLRIGGQGRTVELLEIAGPMHAGLDLLPAGGVDVRGCRFEVAGPALTVAEGARAAVTGCVFVKRGPATDHAISVMSAGEIVMKRNVFAGYGADVVKGLSAEALRQVRANNSVFGAEAR